MADDLLAELAAHAEVPGLDWVALNASGNGLMQSTVYIDQLDEIFQPYIMAVEAINLTDAEISGTSPEMARTAWEMARGAVERQASAVFDALGEGELRIAWNHAVTIHTAVLRNLIIGLHAMTMDALGAHDTGLVQYAVETGEITLEEAQSDVDDIARLWRCVVQLHDSGVLDALKTRAAPAAGLGLAPAVAALAASWPVALVVIATIAIIATCIMVMHILSERNQQRREWCLDASGAVRADAPEWCKEAPDDPLAAFLGPAREGAAKFGSALGVTLGVGALAFVGYWAVPRMMAKRKA